jgi:hypothetical protein
MLLPWGEFVTDKKIHNRNLHSLLRRRRAKPTQPGCGALTTSFPSFSAVATFERPLTQATASALCGTAEMLLCMS